MTELQLINDLEKWEELKRQLDLLEYSIKQEILERKETVKIGAVEAKFTPPAKNYDYETAVNAYNGEIDVAELISANSKTTVNWYRVCNGLGIDRKDVDYEEGKPSVRIKLR